MAAKLAITTAWLCGLLSWAVPTLAAMPAWDDLIAAAQKEGRVVVIGPPDPEVRRVLPAAFKERFGVTLEFSGGRTSDQAARLRAERGAGRYTVDLAIAGAQSMATIFHREKMLAPLRPALSARPIRHRPAGRGRGTCRASASFPAIRQPPHSRRS